ncbi:hypothetical protein BJ170DRAFT_729406 [Xylariales sp. AK1849]|nr:hypothetical protein BJ170DRAFT_729406 [Xylariales sp. AK1849]
MNQIPHHKSRTMHQYRIPEDSATTPTQLPRLRNSVSHQPGEKKQEKLYKNFVRRIIWISFTNTEPTYESPYPYMINYPSWRGRDAGPPGQRAFEHRFHQFPVVMFRFDEVYPSIKLDSPFRINNPSTGPFGALSDPSVSQVQQIWFLVGPAPDSEFGWDARTFAEALRRWEANHGPPDWEPPRLRRYRAGKEMTPFKTAEEERCYYDFESDWKKKKNMPVISLAVWTGTRRKFPVTPCNLPAGQADLHRCNTCNFSFLDKNDLELHMNDEHTEA